MASLEEKIPAFSMWQIFYDTMSRLPKLECPLNSIKQLEDIVNSKELSQVLLYNHNSQLSFEQYETISERYVAFTTWLLGQFFYLLSCEKLSQMHKIALDAQLKILYQISIREPYIYHKLTEEYSLMLQKLMKYKGNETWRLEVFRPCQFEDLLKALDLQATTIEINSEQTCLKLKSDLLVFAEKILIENLTSYYLNEQVYNIFDSLICILKTDGLHLKLAVMAIYYKILNVKLVSIDKFPVRLKEKFKIVAAVLEHLTYDLMNLNVRVSDDELNKFEEVLLCFLGYECCENTGIKMRISIFILSNLDNTSFKVTEELQVIASKLLLPYPSELSKCNLDLIKDLHTSNTRVKLIILEKKIIDEIKCFISNKERNNTKVVVKVASNTWQMIYELIEILLLKLNCDQDCELKDTLEFINKVLNMIVKIKLFIQTFLLNSRKIKCVSFECFNEAEFLMLLIAFVNNHLQNCKLQFPNKTFVKVLTFIPLCASVENVDVIFHIIAYQFLPVFYKSNNDLPTNVIGYHDKKEAQNNMKLLYNRLALLEENKATALENVCHFMFMLTVAIINDINEMENRRCISSESFNRKIMEILINILPKSSVNMQSTLAKYLPHIVSFCKYVDSSVMDDSEKVHLLGQILNYLTQSSEKTVLMQITKVLRQVLCNIYSHCKKIIFWTTADDSCLMVKYVCTECNPINDEEDEEIVVASCYVNKSELAEVIDDGKFFKCLWRLFKIADVDLKVNFVEVLPALAKHITDSFAQSVEDWMQYADDNEKPVRLAFNDVIDLILEINFGEHKEKTLEYCFKTFYDLAKKSLQYSDFDLQVTLLFALERLTTIKIKGSTLKIATILLYFIMMPTSKHYRIAEYVFIKLSEKQGTKPISVYTNYRKELCEYIAKLCGMCLGLMKSGLNESLEKVSLVMGFFGSKHFVTSQSSYLLPFLVPMIVQMPQVTKLVEEVANMLEISLSEMLQNNYSTIFTHVFLNESDETFKYCMNYLEKAIGLKGPSLRKMYLRTILNELLLNFSEKQDRVLLSLKLLSREGSDVQMKSVQDYLQPLFLGVLHHFDTKLKKLPVLLSLVQLFRFMGPKNIAPFRFKIIAMLRTALLSYSPELNCDVWNAFVRSCDTKALGPQLATIFVSLLPQMQESCEQEMNNIFKYLVVENEDVLKDYISDLFFALDFDISYEVQVVVKKYVRSFELSGFSEQLKWLMKYLTHDTDEVKTYALKYLKKMMEKNRKELDQMILTYNGIDPAIVDLLDILMIGCRSKDAALKLICGECVGELGAIEPSHLPRKYTQVQSFSFFVTEDAFILNTLTELVRAFQAEKNTKCMDRFALAIQETLKHYGISPELGSTKHALWNSFSQPQQQLMLPLLSSRYKIGQPLEPIKTSPIYGSSHGTNYRTWVYNWTWVLIMTIKADKRNLLEVYLPSLKDDQRLLMQFLPHILLHSLLEGNQNDQKRAYEECTAVINSLYVKKPISNELLYTRPLRVPHITVKSIQNDFDEDFQDSQCIKVIFVLLDFLDRWMREWEWQRGAAGREHEDYKTIQLFLSKFCKLQLAKANFKCQEYTRALMYLEDYIINNSKDLDNQLPLLAQIYAQLDETDAVAGVTALQQTEPSLEQKILALEVSGKLSDASACYERIPPPFKLRHLKGLIQCYLDLDSVNTALTFAEGAIQKQPEFESILLEEQAEPLWRLGRYDDLENLLAKPELRKNDSWGVQTGHLLLNLKNGKKDEFKNALSALRNQQVNSLSATSLEEGAYQHGYKFIAKLHALNELEQIEKIISDLLLKANDHNACASIIKQLTSEWELRIKIVQESVKIIEPILCLRRVALEHTKRIVKDRVSHVIPLINSLLAESWLLSAKIARHNGIHQQAYTYTLKAEEFSPPSLFLEKAKLHWMREEHEQALMTLRRGIDQIFPVDGDNKNVSPSEILSLDQRKNCAEAKLLFATYNDNISNVDTEVNIKYYKEAVDMFRECEKSLISLAQYYDRVFQNFSDEDKDAKGSDMQIHMINYFGKSLQYGTNYVYQSMPRLLSIWFDYGTRLLDVTSPSIKEERKTSLLKMTKLIDTFLERLPSYIFLTAFSQILSRICHPQKEVYIELKSILIKLILQYPQQSMWMMISVIKSSYTVRSKRCAEILGDPKLKTPSMVKFITDFTKLAEKLIELCNKDIPNDVSIANVNTLLRTLPRLLGKDDFSEIMIPTQQFRKLILPNPDFKSSQHNPFPNHYVHIVGIQDEVVILPSLQRPRKITFRGSDGKTYIQMLKPKDDLRKDFRLMEFNDIVNQMLSREADSRQRRLNIRLYSVAPLNEECGLIEWVPDLVGLRPILMNLYKQRGLGMKSKELKENCCNIRDNLAKKRAVFVEKLLPKHPPILGDWFRKTFPDAQGWLTARTAYTRTTAVMSMVGYILGLGDRHGENILLDSTNGDTIHVDFNCLFNKGESFEWPERVPFRLTHNMVSAMGPLGVEGVFRKSCACTLRVLRTYMNTLMSIVTPFVYDPLVSWPRNIPASSNALNSERTNEQAVEHVRNIELRLQGMIRTRARSISIPLSVDGQANNIILEAMNVDNLCQMYVGWGAYM